MTIEITHPFVSEKTDSLDSTKVQPSNWNEAHDLLMGANAVVGRGAGSGQAAATEIPMGTIGASLLAATTAEEARTAIDAASSAAASTTAAVGAAIHSATAKTTPVDADTMPLIDSAAANAMKKVTWANIKATIKTYFDTLYETKSAVLTALAGLGTAVEGDIIYASAAGVWTRLPKGSASQVLKRNAAGTGYEWGSGGSTLGTPRSPTSGGTDSFTGLPSGLKRITVTFEQLKITTNSIYMYLRIGSGGVVKTSGYSHIGIDVDGGTFLSDTAYMQLTPDSVNQPYISGSLTLTLTDSSTNTWMVSGHNYVWGTITSDYVLHSGYVSLSGALNIVQVGGSAGAFASGKWNILYE